MSTDLSIATVTASLYDVIRDSVRQVVPNATVAVGPPTGKPSPPEVFLYLYRCEPNADMRNLNLAARDRAGDRIGPNLVFLDLHYVITFYGDRLLGPSSFASERMLAAVAGALGDGTALSPEQIQQTVRQHSDLVGSVLAEQRPTVTVSPVALSLDELSKLWSVFFQSTHRISLTYRVSPVVLDPNVPLLVQARPGRPSLVVEPRSPRDES